MVNLLLNDNLTALRQSVKFGVHDLRKFFYFLFVILGNVEASAAARFLSRFAVRGLLASTKAVIMDLKQCLKWLINACIKLAYPNSEILVHA